MVAIFKSNKKTKPHINELFSIILQHQTDIRRAMLNGEWAKSKEIEANFRNKMRELGIEDHFDWTEDDKTREFNEKRNALLKKES